MIVRYSVGTLYSLDPTTYMQSSSPLGGQERAGYMLSKSKANLANNAKTSPLCHTFALQFTLIYTVFYFYYLI